MGYYIQSARMSMKYMLIIWVCSFLDGPQCSIPIKYPTPYNSWYECSRAAHLESLKMMSTFGFKYVNDNRLGTKYTCRLDLNSV